MYILQYNIKTFCLHLVVPPKPSWIATSVLKTELPVRHSSDYTNNIDENDDDAYDIFEEYKQHLHQSPCPEGTHIYYGNGNRLFSF